MDYTYWILLFLAINLIHFAGTWKLYKKAGYSPSSALIPFYNVFVLMKIIKRPNWWTLLFFIPIVNNVMVIVAWVDLLKYFGKTEKKDQILSVATLGLYLAYLSYTEDLKYHQAKIEKKEEGWLSAIVFTIVAATIIRTFSFQAYTIPTSSMEKSMMVGDFLFVNKMSYGTRAPMTQFTLPLLHDSIPYLGIKSYTDILQFPYFRFPGISTVKNNDIVVFNYPMVDAPVDKKTNYIKRCIAIAGDSLEIRNGQTFINGQLQNLPEGSKGQFLYKVTLNDGGFLRQEFLIQRMDITDPIMTNGRNRNILYMNLTQEKVEILKKLKDVKSVEQFETPAGTKDNSVFPGTQNWNPDNLGPIYIPKKGATVAINQESLPFYKRIIENYEQNSLEVKESKIYINGQESKSYTFKQNYYWMMGDNRHNSLDSRFWGYVPEDHIEGKPSFIWMSINANGKGLDKIRWDRVMTGISDQGLMNDHKILVAILIALAYAANWWFKKKRFKV
jgi:signal peptidase I